MRLARLPVRPALGVTLPVMGLVAGIGLGALVLLVCDCKLNSPPPCDPSTAVWPDPCADGYAITQTATDAGRDASRD